METTSFKRYLATVIREKVFVVIANLVGAFLTAFYFSSLGGVPMNTLEIVATQLFAVALAAGLVGLTFMVNTRLDRPFLEWYRQAATGQIVGPAPNPFQRRVLNRPFWSACIGLSMWSLAALLASSISSFNPSTGWSLGSEFVNVFLGVQISGMVTAVMIYFATERIWQPELPLFFPGGDLERQPSLRLRVGQRLLVLFVMALVPLLELALLGYGAAQRIASASQPAALLPAFRNVELFLCFIGLLTAVTLAQTLGKSLVDPLEKLSAQMQKVTQGDLSQRAKVVSKDEIGQLALHFNRMIGSLQRRETELRTVYQISQEITNNLELDPTLQTILERVGQMIAYRQASIHLTNTPGGELVQRACLGEGKPCFPSTITMGEGFLGQVAAHREGSLAGGPEGTYVGAPLLVGEKLVGVIAIYGDQPGAFDAHDQQLLETIAPQAAIAIQNATQVLERERALKVQIEQLRIEIDQVNRSRQVSEITDTDYFHRLKEEAKAMRARRRTEDES